MFNGKFLFLLVGVICLIAWFIAKNKINDLINRCNKKVTATITKRELFVVDSSDDDPMNMSYYWYEYEINGKVYHTKTKYLVNTGKYKVGDTMDIYYNENDYNEIYNPKDSIKNIIVIPLLLGILFIISGIVSFFII